MILGSQPFLALLAVLVQSALALLSGTGCEPALDRAAELPASCSMVIAVDGASDLRQSEPGRRLAEMLLDTPAAPALSSAWGVLASELGLGAEQAFDDLLGESVMVIFRGDPPESGQWALVTRVSDRTQRRVVEALRPGAREIKGGLPILSMERGQFVMAMRPAGDARGSGEVVFAPAASRELFAELCAYIGRAPREATLAQTPALVEARALERGSVLVLRRSAETEFALTARPDGAGWVSAFALRRLSAKSLPPSRAPWTAPDLGLLGEPTALAMVGDVGLLRRASFLLAPGTERDAPESDEAGRLGALWMLRARDVEPGLASVTWGAEARDLTSAAAALDRRMAEALTAMTGPSSIRGPDFGGRALGTVRTVSTGQQAGSLAWAAIRGDDPRSGWLVVHRGGPGSSAALAVRRLGAALRAIRPEAEPAGPARLVGLLRPALLPDWALSPELTSPLTLRAAQGVSEIRWEVSDSGDRLTGHAAVRLVSPRRGN
jgi:hypothetical protein